MFCPSCFSQKKPFSIDVRTSSLLIQFIEQTKPANYFLHGSFSMMTIIFKSWIHTFKWCMGIFFIESWFPFLIKWNSMNVSSSFNSLVTQRLLLKWGPYSEFNFCIRIMHIEVLVNNILHQKWNVPIINNNQPCQSIV
jgi:hypothetical protein